MFCFLYYTTYTYIGLSRQGSQRRRPRKGPAEAGGALPHTQGRGHLLLLRDPSYLLTFGLSYILGGLQHRPPGQILQRLPTCGGDGFRGGPGERAGAAGRAQGCPGRLPGGLLFQRRLGHGRHAQGHLGRGPHRRPRGSLLQQGVHSGVARAQGLPGDHAELRLHSHPAVGQEDAPALWQAGTLGHGTG